MGIETQAGDIYRLIVALEGRVVEVTDHRFKCFEQAQARVAEAVCRYAQTARVRAVVLQRGRPNTPVNRGGNGSPTRVPLGDGDFDWTVEKRWGTDVIRRILLQNGLEAPAAASLPRADGSAVPRTTVRSVSPGRTVPARPIGKHRSTRWHLTATVAVVILVMVVLILVQTGGHPSRLLSAITGAKPTVKNELPFDARTSFAPGPQPETHAPLDGPEGRDSKSGDGT